MTEHLDTDLLARRTADMLLFHLTVDLCHLIHIQLTCQYDDVSELSIETQRLNVRDIQLGRQMHLLAYLITVGHHSHITSNDCRDAGRLRRVDNLVHQRDILTVDNRVDGQVALDSMLTTGLRHLLQIVNGEG